MARPGPPGPPTAPLLPPSVVCSEMCDLCSPYDRRLRGACPCGASVRDCLSSPGHPHRAQGAPVSPGGRQRSLGPTAGAGGSGGKSQAFFGISHVSQAGLCLSFSSMYPGLPGGLLPCWSSALPPQGARILSLVWELRFSPAAPCGPKYTDRQTRPSWVPLPHSAPRHPSLQTVTWAMGHGHGSVLQTGSLGLGGGVGR